jgi:cytidylate kinase
VVGDDACKIKRVMEFRNFTEKEARSALNRHNRLRKRYHNSFCDGKWGDSRCYDLCINSSRLGVSGTAELLEHYIRCKMNQTS